MASIPTINVRELARRSEQGRVDVIDVRTPAEYREVHVATARNVPLDSLDPQSLALSKNGSAGEPLYVICQSGNRSSKACQKFLDAGITNVISVEGGTRAWDEAGLPVVRGKKTISLERQVRIAAGFLVLLGSVLGYFVDPYWLGLSAFVGAGLMFAGITDTCGMAMLLARMPWNQVKDEKKSTTPPTCCAH